MILKRSRFLGSKKVKLGTKNICIFSTNQFLAVQGACVHQILPFLVCRLVITFCGSKKTNFGVKNSKIRYPKCAFSVEISFSNAKQQIEVDPK